MPAELKDLVQVSRKAGVWVHEELLCKQKSQKNQELSHNLYKPEEAETLSCSFAVLSGYHGNQGFTREAIICQHGSCYCLQQGLIRAH